MYYGIIAGVAHRQIHSGFSQSQSAGKIMQTQIKGSGKFGSAKMLTGTNRFDKPERKKINFVYGID